MQKFNELKRQVASLLHDSSAEVSSSFAMGLESMDVQQREEVEHSISNQSAALHSVLEALDLGEMSDTSVRAATLAMSFNDANSLTNVGLENMQHFPSGSSVVQPTNSNTMSKPLYAMEEYEPQYNRALPEVAVIFNLMASEQDEFTEAFFPTMVLAPNVPGFTQTIRTTHLHMAASHNENGDITKFTDRNLVQAWRDPSIFQQDLLRITPVVRTESAKYFVDPALIPAHNVQVRGETIETAPLKIGERINILGLSQTANMLTKGIMNRTDVIDSAVRLVHLYLQAGDDIIRLETGNYLGTNFTFDPQGAGTRRILSVSTTAPALSKVTKRYDGSNLTTLAILGTNNLTVRIGIAMGGDVDVEDGKIHITPASLWVEAVSNEQGELLPLDAGDGLAVVTALANMSIIGYDVGAFRTNSNKREQGHLVRSQTFSQSYAVPYRTTLTSMSPVDPSRGPSGDNISDLVNATRAMASASAVDKLFEVSSALRQVSNAPDADGNAAAVIGLASLLVKPTFYEKEIDLAAVVASHSSANRAEDVSAALSMYIRYYVQEMLRNSQVRTAIESTMGAGNRKVTVVVGTNEFLRGYVMSEGEFRTAGVDVNVQVVSTSNKKMDGKMFLTLRLDGAGVDQGNPFNFGFTQWIPTAPVVMPMSRDGQISREATINPRFDHYVNMPVLTELSFINIEQLADRIPVFTRTV